MKKTALNDEHIKLNAKILPFAGYYMPITYGKISNWAMCSRKNGILISKSLDEANKILDSNKYINYHELGRELLWKQIYYLQK